MMYASNNTTVAMAERVGVIVLMFIIIETVPAKYLFPNVTIQVFRPKGFAASIPDTPEIISFSFDGNINRSITPPDIGSISGTAVDIKQGRWVAEDLNTVLQVGDVIHYYIEVVVNVSGQRQGYNKGKFVYIVSEDSFSSCKPTYTAIRGSVACKGQTIFEDDFEKFRSDVWRIEQYIPFYSMEFPFVSYQSLNGSDATVSVTNDNLVIKLKLQQEVTGFTEDSIYHGSLNLLQGCTSAFDGCKMEAFGPNILPPIVSGKITSKGFAFTYGTMYIRAKLPQGDWIYPEILLEPLLKKYGSMQYRSGLIKIATVHGNQELNRGPVDYSNKVLYGGPIIDFQCRDFLLRNKSNNDSMWGDDFHVYAVRWEPARITLLVDDVEWARWESEQGTLYDQLPNDDICHGVKLSQPSRRPFNKMVPFDDFFYLTLGLAVGGVTEFPDDVTSWDGSPKPWSNLSRKAMVKFWQHIGWWLDTWNQPQMVVDYVKVVAL